MTLTPEEAALVARVLWDHAAEPGTSTEDAGRMAAIGERLDTAAA